MFKILLALLLMTSQSWANQWRAGTGENTILGSSNASDIDANSYNSIVKPLDSLLATYCNEYLQYASSSTLTVSAGSVMVSNSGGTIRLMLQDSAITTLTSANLDTGAFSAGTTYYVYATAATNAATSSTYYISASNTSPSGQTYYFQIGSFIMDSSTHITNIVNNYTSLSGYGASTAKSVNTAYQALTDGQVDVSANFSSSGNTQLTLATDSSSSPSTTKGVIGQYAAGAVGISLSASMAVRKGDYYKVTSSGANYSSFTMYFTPTSR